LRLRTMDQARATMSSAMTAKEPPMTVSQNQPERRRGGGP
jgi:hypothetical protein